MPPGPEYLLLEYLDAEGWQFLTFVVTPEDEPTCRGHRGGRAVASLAIERDRVAAVLVQLLATGHAPWPAHCLAAAAADPEPGWVLPAVDAELDGARQQAGRGRWAVNWPASAVGGASLADGADGVHGYLPVIDSWLPK
jgi:hypothetical protein